MIVGRFGVVIAPRLPRQAPPAALPSRTRPGGSRSGLGPEDASLLSGKDLRVALTGSGPGVGSGAIKMAARRRRSAWVIAALRALLGGWEERVQIAARPVQSKTVALQGETNGQTAPVTHIHAARPQFRLSCCFRSGCVGISTAR